jgi:hypothetical protein
LDSLFCRRQQLSRDPGARGSRRAYTSDDCLAGNNRLASLITSSLFFLAELHMESLREVGLYHSPFSLVSGLKQQQILLAVFED